MLAGKKKLSRCQFPLHPSPSLPCRKCISEDFSASLLLLLRVQQQCGNGSFFVVNSKEIGVKKERDLNDSEEHSKSSSKKAMINWITVPKTTTSEVWKLTQGIQQIEKCLFYENCEPQVPKMSPCCINLGYFHSGLPRWC